MSSGAQRPRLQARRPLAPIAALALAAGVLCGPVGSADATTAPSPYRMTTRSWDGVRLGMPIADVAQQHKWVAEDCDNGWPPDFIRESTAPYGIELAVSRRPGRVGFIEVYKPSVKGPQGLRVGARQSAIKNLLSNGTKHHLRSASIDEWFNYWVIPTRAGAFLYVRFGDGYDFRKTPHNRVATFGLAVSRREARDRGTTQGGCY